MGFLHKCLQSDLIIDILSRLGNRERCLGSAYFGYQRQRGYVPTNAATSNGLKGSATCSCWSSCMCRPGGCICPRPPRISTPPGSGAGPGPSAVCLPQPIVEEWLCSDSVQWVIPQCFRRIGSSILDSHGSPIIRRCHSSCFA